VLFVNNDIEGMQSMINHIHSFYSFFNFRHQIFTGSYIITTLIIYYLLTESEVITGKSQTSALMY